MNAYIITLSKIASSYKSALRLQKELDQFNIKAELFEGSYGNEVYEKYNKLGRTHHNFTFKGPDVIISEEWKIKQTTPGIIGCFDSHYRLWEKCVSLRQPIMIFEDDAQVIRGYNNVEFTDVLSIVFSHEKKMQNYLHLLEDPTGSPTALYYHPASMPGAAGYIIKPHAAKILVDEFKNSFLPADNAIMRYLVDIKIHSYMMGKATDREKTRGKSSLIRTEYWNNL